MSNTTIATASRQYATRPQDERFESPQAMIAAAVADKMHSAERVYTLADLTVQPGPDGGLQLASSRGAAAMSHYAFGQLARTLDAPAGFLRDGLSPEIAANVLNYRITQADPGQSVNVLVRGANGAPPLIRAATSETYGRVWDADLYSAIDRQIISSGAAGNSDGWTLPPTWSGEPAGAYRGDRDSFLILTNGGSIVTDPSARNARGDGALYRGIMVRNSEVGAASISIQAIYYRYVCGNHMLWGASVDTSLSFTRRHVGSVAAFRETLRAISTIATKWAHASGDRDAAIVRGLIDHEIAATEAGVISQLRSFGMTADAAKLAYDTAVQTEEASPRSFWGITQGITRISQASGYQDDRYQLDRIAAQVLARGAQLIAA